MKIIIIIKSLLLLILLNTQTFAQTFVNGDLEGNFASINAIPSGWQSVAFTDPICEALNSSFATPDLTGLTGPDSFHGIHGNPHSGKSFVSGAYSNTHHEGLQQQVSGLTVGTSYTISFYQTNVKQSNAPLLDTSGSWAVYLDTYLIGMTEPSISQLPASSNALVWDQRFVYFTATSNTHLFKFMPADDDSIRSPQGLDGALRMGIDLIELNFTTNIPSQTASVKSVYPNPTSGRTFIELGKFYDELDVQIFNALGQKVVHNSYSATEYLDLFIEGSSGVYFVYILADDEYSTLKIIKE